MIYITGKDENQRNVLHHSVIGGNVSLCKYLIEDVKVVINDFEQNGMTIVHMAAYYGKIDLLKYFVEDLKMSIDIKSSPLFYFSKDKIWNLIESGQMKQLNSSLKPGLGISFSPFQCAIKGGHLSIVKYFIEEKCCNPFNINFSGDTILHVAAICGQL